MAWNMHAVPRGMKKSSSVPVCLLNQIYALKRVRVNKGDEKALDSFANEITLLVRLKGHPSIISLVDHVVDRRTGVVHMLMEMGEVDLNKLLQDTAQEGQGQLSLNLVRYTWEQMLHAVHCIHEVSNTTRTWKQVDSMLLSSCLD